MHLLPKITKLCKKTHSKSFETFKFYHLNT